MPNKDGIVSIGFDYKKDLEKMIKDFEAEMNAVSSNTQLSKGMKKQFDNILAEMRDFKSSMDKELANLGSGKVSQSSFKSFKQTVENKFKGIREDIDRLDVSMSDLNKKMGILDSGFSLDKFSKEFEDARQRVISTNDAIENLIRTLGEQGISLFSFDDRNISEIKSLIKEIEKEFQNKRKKDYSLLNQDELQNEYNILHAEFSKLIGQIKFAKKEMSSLEVDSNGFKKAQAQFDLLRFKALNVADAIGLIEDASFDKFELSINEKTNKAFQKNSDILTESVENIEERARLSIKTLNELLSVLNSPKIKDEDATTVSPIITLNTTSKELWEALEPELDKLQKTLNSNPVVTPVKLVVAPTSVSYVETGNLDTSKSYSKKYQKILAKTGEDAVVDLEGVYKKTFTSVMDTAVSYAKDTIDKIQDVFDKNLIKVKFDINQDELDKIQNFVLSNKDGKKVDISGQITKAKQEVEELNESIEKTAKLLDDAKSKGNVKFDGFDKFTQDVSKSISKLEELQNILKALQNIEITLAKASGIASITELDNQWANVEKRIINATKLDGSFRKNASVSKIASEYQKYIDMGGTNSIADIDKIKDNKDTLDTIISKAKEFAKQDLSNDSVKELSIELDGIIGKFDELISTVKTATNALYKIIKQTGVSELDKQWSSITNKFKSIADESGKINLSKQKKDVEELLVMYQRYVNMGGSHTPFDLTDNLETVAKLDKAYKKLNETKPIDNSSTIKSETESFRKVEQSVESLTKAIGDTKVQAINVEATAMEDAAEREILAINAIVDNLDTVVKKLKDIKGIKPKIEIKETTSPVETNISSPIKDTFQGGHSDNSEAFGVKQYKKKGYKAHDTGNHDNERKVANKKELSRVLKELQTEIIASIDESTQFVKEVTDFYDSQDNLVKTQMKIGDKNGSMSTYTTSYSTDKEGNSTAWTSHITSEKVAEKTKQASKKIQAEWDKNVKAIQEYMDANTKLNNLKAQDKGTGKKSSEIVYQTKEVERLEKVALEARAALSSMINPHEAPIDDWNKWLEVMKQFDQATEGSARSVAQLEDALRNMGKAQLDSAQSKIDSYIKKLNPYTDTAKYTSEFISRVSSAQSEIKEIDVASPEGLARLKEIESIVNEIIKDSNLLENKLVKQDSKIADIISKMKIFRDSNTNMSKSQRADLQALIDSAEVMAKTGDVTAEAMEHIKTGFSGIKAEVTATGNTGLKMIDRIVQRAEDMNAKFIAQFFSWQDIIRYGKEGIQVIRELDTALTEMRKVSDESASSLKNLQDVSFDLADSVGTTAIQIQNSIADFMRIGDSAEEARKHALDANTLLQVSEFDNIEDATSALVSMNQAWKDVDTQHINDVLNILGNNMPIATDELASSLQRSAGTLATLGATLEEAAALTVAGNSILQDPDSVAAGKLLPEHMVTCGCLYKH